MAEIAERWLVEGLVQGVSFRYFTLRRAQELGLAGRVRNLPDGNVEVVVRGDEEVVARLRKAVEQGPPHSRVLRVSISPWGGEARWTDFSIGR